MDELDHLRAVRDQRRVTVAAIEAVEQWSRANREPGNVAFTTGVDLYLKSLEVSTVEELAHIEAQARAYLLGLQSQG